jgi:hypothetical protein
MSYESSRFDATQQNTRSALTKRRPLPFLTKGKKVANRRKAQSFVRRTIPGVTVVDERTIKFNGYGRCHFAAYTDPKGAMISTPHRDDNEFGSKAWHFHDYIMMFRDMGDGKRVVVYVCPIPRLFGLRTIGDHGVSWNDVRRSAKYINVIPIS